ncbi:MAG: helix-turn-helix domain-containing protein [Cyclobacteriaceae bacterium]|nr:helix-turn-helix domain-containing protein [Cyclobacteriaceae bacterium]
MTIAERIRLNRQQKKIQKTQLSEKAGINLKSLSRYELGFSIPPANVLKDIADALEVSANTLLSDEQITIKEKGLLKNIEGISKNMIVEFLDLAIRDAKAAYAS